MHSSVARQMQYGVPWPGMRGAHGRPSAGPHGAGGHEHGDGGGLDPGLLAFVGESLVPPPATVLEVGAGDGALAEALRGAGYEVAAIDPEPGGPGVEAVALLDVDAPPDAFDAAVAVVSLHHVDPLEASCRRLGELVRPGGVLVLAEFDVERVDERAAGWWIEASGNDDHTPAEVVAELRRHCHPIPRLQAALEPWFALEPPARAPYLYRWARRPELRGTEERLIAAGELAATGVRIVGRRR
jgi:SAM-dependent methyltransferase